MHRETEKRDRGEQAVEDLDPVLGVVRWAAVAVERVAWSRAPWWRVSHWREAVSVSFGIDVTQKKEESSLCSGEERERARPGESGKVWTMTQGHEAHGDGGGTEELLIAACGIAHRHHGAGERSPLLPPVLHPP